MSSLVHAVDGIDVLLAHAHAQVLARAQTLYSKVKRSLEKPSKPVCAVCEDTHVMHLESQGDVMCTHCPVPCGQCRASRNGPFCATTPCSCECHALAIVHAEPTEER